MARNARTFLAVGGIATRCAVFVALVVGCAARTSTLRVDGTSFVPVICQSGQTRGFVGVELVDDQQRRLRLARGMDGGLQAVYLPSGASTGEHLSDCGTISLKDGTRVVNGVRNIDGEAELRCEAGTAKVTGWVTFKGCH